MATAEAKKTGAYEKDPWGYAGMGVRIYRALSDGSLYGMRSARGVIATAKTVAALSALARRERWAATTCR